MTGYRIQVPPTTELHRREIDLRLRMLRDMHKALGMREQWFETVDDLLNYLNDVVGIRTQQGARITKPTLRAWCRHRAFPLFRNGMRVSRIASSNILVMAWLWTMRFYRERTPVRAQPQGPNGLPPL